MTAIAGVVGADGKVYIGGDSASAAGWSIKATANPKVFLNRGVAFGFTSSWRMGQILQHAFKPPLHDPDLDVVAYLVGPFVNDLRQVLKDGGFATIANAVEAGGHFLIGYRGRLFHLQEDFSVLEVRDGYDAVGCGEDLCRGALFATQSEFVNAESPPTPETRITTALRAATRWSAGVTEPFTIVHTEPHT